MGKFLLLSICILVVSCNPLQPKETNKPDLEKYFVLKYGSYNNNGEIINYVTPTIVQNLDPIGKIIDQRQRQILYLLTNRINSDTLNKLFPDTIAIQKAFIEELGKPNFKSNLEKIIYPNQQKKQVFTKNQMMSIASRFFLAEKLEDDRFGIRICSGLNGQIENLQTDFTQLEVMVFDAIFERIVNPEMPKAKFLVNANNLVDHFLQTSDSFSLDSLRNYVYEAMKKDKDLRKTILEFNEVNKKNLPIEIIENK